MLLTAEVLTDNAGHQVFKRRLLAPSSIDLKTALLESKSRL